MKKMTRRNFLQTSALAGAAALVSGMSVAAGAAAPEAASTAAAVDEENCINLAGTSPIEMASVQVKPGKLIGYLDGNVSYVLDFLRDRIPSAICTMACTASSAFPMQRQSVSRARSPSPPIPTAGSWL